MPSVVDPVENEPQNLDVLRLQTRGKRIATQSLESTRRMVGMVDESKETGMRTLVALDEQGEKLDIIEEGNSEIRSEMKQAENHLKEMEKCCGIFALPWKRNKTCKADLAWKKSKSQKVVEDQPHRVAVDVAANGGYICRITNDDDEEEMEQNLAHVHSTVGNLKSMAAGINAEVKNQNRKIDTVVLKVNSNDQHVKEADSRVNKISHR